STVIDGWRRAGTHSNVSSGGVAEQLVHRRLIERCGLTQPVLLLELAESLLGLWTEDPVDPSTVKTLLLKLLLSRPDFVLRGVHHSREKGESPGRRRIVRSAICRHVAGAGREAYTSTADPEGQKCSIALANRCATLTNSRNAGGVPKHPI